MGQIEVNCPSCQGEIPVEDVNLDRLIGKCRSCNTVFSFANQVSTPAVNQTPVPSQHYGGKRPEVALPKSLQIDKTGKSIKMSIKWFDYSVLFLTFFCCFWDIFMLVWYGIAIFEGIWIMAIFGLLHAGVGVGLTYFCLCSWFNTTEIELDGNYFRITHGPLPWWGNKEMPTSEFVQFFTKEHMTRGKHGPHYTYELYGILKNGGKEKLISGLNSVEQSLFLEQEAERFLGIEDEAVPGEVPRY